MAYLVYQALLAYKAPQESPVQAFLDLLAYLGREDRRGIKVCLGFPFLDHLDLMDTLEPLAYLAHLAHLELLFHPLASCVSEAPLAFQDPQESRDFWEREVKKVIKETPALTA